MISWLFPFRRPDPEPPSLDEILALSDFREIVDKPWGACKRMYSSPRAAMYELDISPHGYSSIHWHECKDQVLWVHLGLVCLKQYDESGESLLRCRWLSSGQACVTRAGTRHQFYAPVTSVVTEIYLPAVYGDNRRAAWRSIVREEDIVRLTDSGCGPEGGADIPD